MESRKQWDDTLKGLKEKKRHPNIILYATNLPFKNKYELKTLSDKRRMIEVIARRSSIEILKKSFRLKRNDIRQ